MTRFLLYRLLQFPLILALIYLITFLLAWCAPGSPFEQTDRHLDPIAMEQLERQFHAEHWYTFLGYYPARIVLHGDFGPSMQYKGWSVNEILKSGLPVSASLPDQDGPTSVT